MTIAIVVIAAALIGAAGPFALRKLPEPPEPEPATGTEASTGTEDPKIAYAVLAQRKGLALGLAVAAAVMGGVVAWRVDVPELLPVWAVLAGVGAWLTFIDWHTKLLPFLIVAPLYLVTLLLVGLGALLLGDIDVLKHALIANVVVYLVFRILYWFGGRFFGGAFGYGDVRLAAVLALALGALGSSEVMVGMYAGFILGAVFGVLLSAVKLIDPKAYAFGPYLVIGAVIGAAWGPAIYQI